MRAGYYPLDLRYEIGTGFMLPFHLAELRKKLRINCVFGVAANVGQYALMLRKNSIAATFSRSNRSRKRSLPCKRQVAVTKNGNLSKSLSAHPGRRTNKSNFSLRAQFVSPSQQALGSRPANHFGCRY
jgi:hypothetical protein